MENKKASAVRLLLAAELIAAGLVLIGALVTAVMLGIYMLSIFELILAAVIAVVTANETPSNRRYRGRRAVLGLILLTAAAFLFVMPCYFSGNWKWRYVYQRHYAANSGCVGDIECFPQELPESAGDFHTEYQPSFFQAAGHYSISFTAADEEIARYKTYAENRAVFVCSLREWLSWENGERMSDQQNQRLLELSGGSSASLSLWADENIRRSPDTVTVYVLDSDFEWNHPYTCAVLVDEQNHLVEFSQLGNAPS